MLLTLVVCKTMMINIVSIDQRLKYGIVLLVGFRIL